MGVVSPVVRMVTEVLHVQPVIYFAMRTLVVTFVIMVIDHAHPPFVFLFAILAGVDMLAYLVIMRPVIL
jgi:hypothetical protein